MVNKFEMRLDPQSPVPLYAQIGETIRQAIEQGEFKPGDFLPTNRAVAEALNVDQKTVHRAFAELHRQKLVGRKRGKGTFVLNTSAHNGAVGLVCDICQVQQFWMLQSLVQAVQGYCASQERRHMLYAVSSDPTMNSAFDALQDDLQNRRLSALLFLNWNSKLPELYEQARKQRLPVVCASVGLADVADYVVHFDMLQIIQQATRSLVEQGKKRVGLLFNVRTRSLPDRAKLVEIISQAGGESKVEWLAAGPCTQQGGYEASEKLPFEQLDAVIALDDYMGMGLEQRLIGQGVQVPRDLAVVIVAAGESNTHYRTAVQPYVLSQQAHGDAVIKLLDDVLAGKRIHQPVVPMAGRLGAAGPM